MVASVLDRKRNCVVNCAPIHLFGRIGSDPIRIFRLVPFLFIRMHLFRRRTTRDADAAEDWNMGNYADFQSGPKLGVQRKNRTLSLRKSSSVYLLIDFGAVDMECSSECTRDRRKCQCNLIRCNNGWQIFG